MFPLLVYTKLTTWQYVDEDDFDVVTQQRLPAILVMKCFRASASLCSCYLFYSTLADLVNRITAVIIGAISSLIYPVKATRRGSKRAILSELEARLDQWYYQLPADLRYDPASKRAVPLPPVLFIHIKYWFTVLLLHRALYANSLLLQITDKYSLVVFQTGRGTSSRHFTIKSIYIVLGLNSVYASQVVPTPRL